MQVFGMCAVDGCDRPHQSRGYCKGHAQRLRKTGSTGSPFGERITTEECVVDGCPRPRSSSSGYCAGHYRRTQQLGFPGPPFGTRAAPGTGSRGRPRLPRVEVQPDCTVTDCTEPAWAASLCQRHYWRKRRTGRSGGTRRRKLAETCTVPGCDSAGYARDLCQSHYLARWRSQNPGSAHERISGPPC
jgi:hypothetical protein